MISQLAELAFIMYDVLRINQRMSSSLSRVIVIDDVLKIDRRLMVVQSIESYAHVFSFMLA